MRTWNGHEVKVGFWMDREGEKCRVLAIDGKTACPIIIETSEGDVFCLTPCGQYPNGEPFLQEPWVDRPIDWSKQPDWVNAIAMDKNGKWYRHSMVPKLCNIYWGEGGFSQNMHISEYPQFTGKWQDSLSVRPKGGAK